MRRIQQDFGAGKDGRLRDHHQRFGWKTKVVRPMTQRRGGLRSTGGQGIGLLVYLGTFGSPSVLSIHHAVSQAAVASQQGRVKCRLMQYPTTREHCSVVLKFATASTRHPGARDLGIC